MEKDFVPYELSVKLKELGFDEHELCFAHWIERDERDGGGVKLEMWNDEDTYYEVKSLIKAPTFSQAFRWFDEHTDLMGFVVPSIKDNHFDWLIRVDWEEEIECEEAYSSRIEAELACLTKLIEIVESKSE